MFKKIELAAIVKKRFNTIAGQYYENTIYKRRQAYNDALDKQIFPYLKKVEFPSILDAGCGSGIRAKHIKEENPECRIYGIDLSENMVQSTLEKDVCEEVSVQNLTSINYPDNRFDFVLCLFFVICYLVSDVDREKAVCQLYRVLKPGGLLFIDAINIWHLGEGKEFKRTVWDALGDSGRHLLNRKIGKGDKLYSTNFNGNLLDGYFHGFTKKRFHRLLTGNGFKSIRNFTIGYNTGNSYSLPWKGQLFEICRKSF